ncbi:MAG: glycoside hydrolase family 3 N-terminal domain-containing protein, partial [Anaerolineales bacterium]
MLALLSPEERIGQLFLVTFSGTQVGEDTPIYDMIVNKHIGGVVLLTANDNFVNGENTTGQIQTMNRQLQLNRWAASQQPRLDQATNETFTIHFTPLLIGTYQEGDGYPYDQILSGLTQLPNGMAMGATWNTDLTNQVGDILGNELASMGINLLFGPSLDVLETPNPESSSDLGTRTFGGDPFWVGELGRAFLKGVHAGSNGRVATIAKYFPGNGGADRPTEEEVSTVRKSFDQLKKIDLVPFFAVSGDAPSSETTTDALLASHIRYQGFQENIRATTRPVSFDPQAFNQLMSLTPLSTWREAGGVVVSDNLGSRAVRSFYELTGQEYEARQVALNAFLAGNDILYMGELGNGEDADPYAAVNSTLDFFTQKYKEDPAFAQRVDESVLRILMMKYRLYPVFNLDSVLPQAGALDAINQSDEVVFEVAREAATLISPSAAELDNAVPESPKRTDRIVFIGDTMTARQCSQCPEEPIFTADAMQQAVLRLYGPQAGSQVQPFNLKSYSFDDLLVMLDGPRNSTQLEIDLRRAQWIVLSLLGVNKDNPTSQAMSRFLSERPDLFQQKQMIAFAFNAPYYLDATNISKLTAYYGLYSKTPSFVEVAARLLFKELTPVGILPVSVPGVGYDLITMTSPDPNQVIPLTLDQEVQPPADLSITPEPMPTPEIRLGSNLAVRTGIIIDRNGHPVPDGTPVQFIVSTEGVVSAFPQIETTVGGVAKSSIPVTSSGILEVRVESEPAKQSDVLRFDIPLENDGQITATVTIQPSATPEPTATATEPPPPVITAESPPGDGLTLFDWVVAIILSSAISFVFYRLAALAGQVRWGVRGGFFALIGGLVAYCYLALS